MLETTDTLNGEASVLPEEPPSLGALFQRLVEEARRNEQIVNLNRANWYRGGVRNWDINHVKHGFDPAKTKKITGQTRPAPTLLVHYTANPKTYAIDVSEGPELVTPEVPIPVKPEGPPEGHIEFHDRVYGWHVLAYSAGNSNVPVGTDTIHEGKRFKLVELGFKGSMIWRLLWELI